MFTSPRPKTFSSRRDKIVTKMWFLVFLYLLDSRIMKHHRIWHTATWPIYLKFHRLEKFLRGAVFDRQLIYKTWLRPPFDQIFTPFLIRNVRKPFVKTILIEFLLISRLRGSRGTNLSKPLNRFTLSPGTHKPPTPQKSDFKKKQSHLKEHKILRTNIF